MLSHLIDSSLGYSVSSVSPEATCVVVLWHTAVEGASLQQQVVGVHQPAQAASHKHAWCDYRVFKDRAAMPRQERHRLQAHQHSSTLTP